MKTLFTPNSAIGKGIFLGTLISLVFWVYPETLLAVTSEQSAGQNTAFVFQIKNSITTYTKNDVTAVSETTIAEDPLVTNLRAYLQNLNSPLAQYADQIVQLPQWQRALSVSWVESNMCIHQIDNNCSGIGVAPGHKLWRKYPTLLDWFKDMSQLLEKPLYKDQLTTFAQMKGVYVQPGSWSWVYGAQQQYTRLVELTEQSVAQKQQTAGENNPVPIKTALSTFPGLTNNLE